MAIRRLSGIIVLILGTSVVAQAFHWRVGQPQYLYELGTRPSLWNDTIAFQEGNGGPIMYYCGEGCNELFFQEDSCWEPVNTDGSVAWRYTATSASSNEIYRWDGQTISNVSNSPGVNDCDLSGAGNGDLIWSQDHTWLVYYDASENSTQALGVRGVHPDLYVTDDGVATYAYQDPDTDEVYFFDGAETHYLGAGNVNGAYPSVWNGAVAWVGTGTVGSYFTKSEIFYWKNGEVTNITDDTSSGVADEYPCAWNNVVVWARGVSGVFSPRIFMWDSMETTQITTVNAKFPSIHHCRLAYACDDGLYYADVYPTGDLDHDRDVDLDDLAELLSNFGTLEGATYEQGDVDEDGDVDIEDIAGLLGHYAWGVHP